MKRLESELITQANTEVLVEERIVFNAPHHYEVNNVHTGEQLCHVHFQEGGVKEVGVNGIAHEDLIAIVIDRLTHFQNSNYACKENQQAICLLEDTLRVLRSRTNKRIERGVQGRMLV